MFFPILILAAQIALMPPAVQTAQPVPVTGYWEGTVRVPGSAIAIEVTLIQEGNGKMQGTISIPSQSVVDRKLENIVTSPQEISCQISGIPDNPTINGRIEGDTIKGNLRQGGFNFAFELMRVGDTKPGSDQTKEADGQAVQQVTVAGYWEGAIHIPGGSDLAIQVNLIQGENDNDIRGYFFAPAQGGENTRLEGIVIALPKISFRLTGAKGNPIFDGRIDGDIIKGNFTQFGSATTLEIKRVGEAKPIEEALPPKGVFEREITIGAPPFELPGTLTLPDGKGPFSAIILVHGSGPNDRDESIGPSRTFRDIAWGLAEEGIATLRYDKRTYVHPHIFPSSFTLNEETVEDAVLAVSQLGHVQEIKADKIFILGHSLGGYALGRIGNKAPSAAGFISLAGPTRALWDAILEQIAYLGSVRGVDEEIIEKQLEHIKMAKSKILSEDLTSDTPEEELLNTPASYWIDLRGYDPIATLRHCKRPALILQGEADYQVTMEDFANWQKGFPEAAFKSFPSLNHILMPVEGKSTGLEYFMPGQKVDPNVIKTIAEWVLKQ